ncbi:hypothetical protein BO94DRAFT_623342 [Aspergillus sclerotioniger CBS 115572]|uniref:F-box domain-containing protein n=1 Tax=Aspergillus sclerotioniger CBS 115572 TaxID=1450535 RepID=A0A317WW07_9EURO|nr:hypothetical protein BO94DRAFT_623342 [Aspergillus sclerotioniger CBS 115572]PWY90594.1 hypothetical protein BO94DRAFT_623342 [Aspergillus sclerotioniger CBS 115572]
MRKIVSKLKRSLRLSRTEPVDPTNGSRRPRPSSVSDTAPGQSVLTGPPRDVPLETLPPEIRYLIMSMLELRGLQALVHASPVYHRQYLADRWRLLPRCLDVTLQSVAVEACFAYRSGMAEFSETRNPEAVIELLDLYQERRALFKASAWSQDLTADEALGMVTFHLSIVEPLVRRYAVWALGNLAQEPEVRQCDASLSKTEELRLLRSMYRFQLCCNLFGVGCHGTPFSPRSEFDSVSILKVFLSIFEPWEVEEIVCIYAFAKAKYNQIFDDIRWDVHEENPKFDGQRPPTPDGAFDLDNSWIRHSLLYGTISRGLRLLHTVFCNIRDHEHLVSTMQDRISWPAGSFLEHEALGQSAQTIRRRQHPSPRDSKEERRDPLPFQGDRVDDVYPPLAWTLMWRGTYSNLFGYYMEDPIRSWGYVMWDAARLEQSGAKKVLKRQWTAEWRGDDPRDQLL